MGKGVGFKVLTKKGLTGPFLKASVLKGIEMGLVPLKAKLYDMEGERYVVAADLVGEELDHAPPKAKAAPTKKPTGKPKAEAKLELAPEKSKAPAKKQVKLPKVKQLPKSIKLPKARESEVDAMTAAADTQHGTAETKITKADAMDITAEEIAAAVAATAPKPKSKDAARQINEVGELTSIKELILLEDEELDNKEDL
ncbi:hypothetical protein PLCT2_00514 [Planctomycetaceae bacterium]|nr:hypothetical protein PLCT2_00514 [Planctomycetaceae bacterium]